MPEDYGILWVWLSIACGAGSRSADLLLDNFGSSIRDIYEAGEEDYRQIPELPRRTAEKLCGKSLRAAQEVVAFCRNEGVGIITPDSPLYPARLGRIMNRPLVLYYRGILRDLEPEVCIAEVGTRDMSEYGSHSAYSVAYDLAKAGAVVVSGMAKGIDGMAHRGALDAGGYTVAVLGNGIDRAYPSEHIGLMNEITGNGIVLTEFRPFTAPAGHNFPLRNRIISGLSQGTVVIEAPLSSGALITAKYAEEQGRDVFALPGKVGEYNSSGTNRLIRDGAKIITRAADILLEYQPLYGNKINLNNIPSIKAQAVRSPVSLKAASPIPGFSGKAIKEKAARDAAKRSEETMISGAEPNDCRSAGEEPAAPGTKSPETGRIPVREPVGNAPDAAGSGAGIPSDLPEEQKRILSVIYEKKQATSDDIVRETGLPVGEVLAALTMLELTDMITALPGGAYSR